MKHWLLSPNINTVHLQSLVCNYKKLVHSEWGNLHPLKAPMETWDLWQSPPSPSFHWRWVPSTHHGAKGHDILCELTQEHISYGTSELKVVGIFFLVTWVFKRIRIPSESTHFPGSDSQLHSPENSINSIWWSRKWWFTHGQRVTAAEEDSDSAHSVKYVRE